MSGVLVMGELSKGANAPIAGVPITVELHRTGDPVDLTALLLHEDGKVASDADMVFFNQPTAGDGAVRHEAADGDAPERITVEPAALPDSVVRVVLVGSCDPDDESRTFAGVAELTVRAVQTGAEPVVFPVPPMTEGERAAVLLEFYRRGADWKVRAVGQGYRSGLAGVAGDFGIQVADEPAPAQPVQPAPSQSVQPSVQPAVPQSGGPAVPQPDRPAEEAPTLTPALTVPPPAAPSPTAPDLTPTPRPESPSAPATPTLGRLSLDKGAQAVVSLDKNDREVEIVATLVWDGGSEDRRTRGADLDFYALFVPAETALMGAVEAGTKAGVGHTPKGNRYRPANIDPESVGQGPDEASDEEPGRGRWLRRKKRTLSTLGDQDERNAVYYKNLGSVQGEPYIRLDGDSQTPGREVIRIVRPDEQGYVLLCAYSALSNGAGSFRSFGAHVVIDDGRGSVVTVPLYEESETSYWVAIGLVDFTAPAGAVVRHIERYSSKGTERRPVLHRDGTIRMDAGPVEFKDF
ncbi:TerD family protein [Streptomyces sp. NPDC005953]|uniref:TerD family protein n=1 Tax=Streptomyces sp. NPDC005953 TaxID=3156719 RepID=UPI0033D8EAB4